MHFTNQILLVIYDKNKNIYKYIKKSNTLCFIFYISKCNLLFFFHTTTAHILVVAKVTTPHKHVHSGNRTEVTMLQSQLL